MSIEYDRKDYEAEQKVINENVQSENESSKSSSTEEKNCQCDTTTTVVELTVISILVAAYFLVTLYAKPTIDFFTCDQTDILKPYHKNTISTINLVLFGFFLPVLAIIVIELINSNLLHNFFNSKKKLKFQRNVDTKTLRKYIVSSITIFLLGCFVTVLITEITKRLVGRLRPHFLDVCKPKMNEINCYNSTSTGSVYNSIYTGGNFCTGDPQRVIEARLSFPSGHASYSAFTMSFLIVYLEARLIVNRFNFGKLLLQIMSFLACMIISLSRISDFQHHASDVLGGFVLGIAVSSFVTMYVANRLWSIREERDGYFGFKSISNESIKNSSEDTIL